MTRTETRHPRMLFADRDGRIYDHPQLLMAGVAGGDPVLPPEGDLLPLPRGSDLFRLPGRTPVGVDPRSGETVEFGEDGAEAVAAFLAPAHTLALHPAYRTRPEGPVLPLFAYSAAGFRDGGFWATGVRIDPDPRQDPWRFDRRRLEKQVARHLRATPDNRLLAQLERCALRYGCRAAQNFFIGRHEAPLPTSVTCNAQCVGCISLQPDGEFKASHDRLATAPTPEEVADIALTHLERVPDGVVSFGQGCEGEPLLMDELLVASVRRIRAATPSGTIHLNTNASKPEVVTALVEAGLDSMRVSMNSPRPAVYDAYYQPRGYGVREIEQSIGVVKKGGGFVSINYLVFPGVNDTEDEIAALHAFVERTGLDMIQWRNLNIDPELYRRSLPEGVVKPGLGIRALIEEVRARWPALRHGYFNPAR